MKITIQIFTLGYSETGILVNVTQQRPACPKHSMPHPIFHSEFLQNAVSFSNQRLQLHPIELAVSNTACHRDPNSSEATVGISELVRVCVLRYDVFELFGILQVISPFSSCLYLHYGSLTLWGLLLLTISRSQPMTVSYLEYLC